MTKQEAIQKFYDIMYGDSDSIDNSITYKQNNMKWATKAINTYEALGLIKFDEPKGIKFRDKMGNVYTVWDELLKDVDGI